MIDNISYNERYYLPYMDFMDSENIAEKLMCWSISKYCSHFVRFRKPKYQHEPIGDDDYRTLLEAMRSEIEVGMPEYVALLRDEHELNTYYQYWSYGSSYEKLLATKQEVKNRALCEVDRLFKVLPEHNDVLRVDLMNMCCDYAEAISKTVDEICDLYSKYKSEQAASEQAASEQAASEQTASEQAASEHSRKEIDLARLSRFVEVKYCNEEIIKYLLDVYSKAHSNQEAVEALYGLENYGLLKGLKIVCSGKKTTRYKCNKMIECCKLFDEYVDTPRKVGQCTVSDANTDLFRKKNKQADEHCIYNTIQSDFECQKQLLDRQREREERSSRVFLKQE